MSISELNEKTCRKGDLVWSKIARNCIGKSGYGRRKLDRIHCISPRYRICAQKATCDYMPKDLVKGSLKISMVGVRNVKTINSRAIMQRTENDSLGDKQTVSASLYSRAS